MSTHRIDIVRVPEPEPHPNADRLAVYRIKGWQAVARKDLFTPGELAIFVPYDYIVPPGLLDEDQKIPVRIKTQKLRGILSEGALVRIPPEDQLFAGISEGDDVMEELGITHYGPPENTGEVAPQKNQISGGPPPSVAFQVPVFDVENYNNYGQFLFSPYEEVIAREKIHGANARYCWAQDAYTGDFRLHVGARKRWSLPHESNHWTRAAEQCPAIENFCRAFPGAILYGEVYGPTQSLKYGTPDTPRFVGFAVYTKANIGNDNPNYLVPLSSPPYWWDAAQVRHYLDKYEVPQPEIVYIGAYDDAALREAALGDSCIPGAGHEREGLVVQTWPHLRITKEIGPLWLKIINPDYSIRS